MCTKRGRKIIGYKIKKGNKWRKDKQSVFSQTLILVETNAVIIIYLLPLVCSLLYLGNVNAIIHYVLIFNWQLKMFYLLNYKITKMLYYLCEIKKDMEYKTCNNI